MAESRAGCSHLDTLLMQRQSLQHVQASALYLAPCQCRNQTYTLCSPCDHAHLPLLRPKRLVLPCNKTSSLLCRLLLRIPHYNFNIVVMDKHGMDKERYPFPATPAELFALIDKFPLRKDEMKLQAEIGQSCP